MQQRAYTPVQLTSPQRVIVGVSVAIVALTRVLALSRTLWDWDEALFVSAMRHFDVRLHHPHPPGFPLFIGAAHWFRATGMSEFHSLQAVTLIAAVALMPAAFFLARELRMNFGQALIASWLLAFLPNVWFYGGTALSDVPSLVLVIVASALLVRGARDYPSLLAGAVVLGVAAGFRPQNLVIGLAPFAYGALAQLRRHWSRPIVAAVVIGAIVVGSYGAAASLSGGWSAYRAAVAAHQQGIANTDSFLNPQRPSLARLFVVFFVAPFYAPVLNAILGLFVLVSLVRCVREPKFSVVVILLSFGPMAILAWLFLDWMSAGRFAVGYAPLLAFLAADGVSALPRTFARVAATVTVATLAVWTYPAVAVAHAHASPPAAAADWIRMHVPRSQPLDVHPGMIPFIQALLPEYGLGRSAITVREGEFEDPDALVFRRRRQRLEHIVRKRYFEVTISGARQR